MAKDHHVQNYQKKKDVDRTYRAVQTSGLFSYRLTIGESDLWISTGADIKFELERLLIYHRRQLKEYIHHHPEFAATLEPFPDDPLAPQIVRWMIAAALRAKVGPMAAVAGAVSGIVGQNIDRSVSELIIENGGDIYFRSVQERIIAIYAGETPFSMRIGLRLKPKPDGYGICTSAGTVGPSLSLGQADATVVISPDSALADAAATAIGNLVQSQDDLQKAADFARTIPGIDGAVIIKNDRMAAWGEIDLVPVNL